jgi:hypothetical protein
LISTSGEKVSAPLIRRGRIEGGVQSTRSAAKSAWREQGGPRPANSQSQPAHRLECSHELPWRMQPNSPPRIGVVGIPRRGGRKHSSGTSKSDFRSLGRQSDDALIKAIAAGDRSAMRTLYDRHNMRLYRFILRIVADAGRAEDLVSEVFVDVWSQAGRFEGRSQVSTWILSIAHFKALTARHRHRHRNAELDARPL